MREVFAPRPTQSLRDWAKENIKLSTKESGDFPGPYDPDLNPLPTDLWEIIQSRKYNRVIVKKSSQTGVTLVLLIYICYYVRYVCRNFLYVIDVRDEMRRISKERLKPMLRACKAVQGSISENEDDLANLTLSFKGLVGYLCGSNSLGELANKSVGLAIFDETDTYRNKAATAVGRERGKKQSNFISIELSKPENYEDNITQEWLKGSKHQHHFPCPHCGTVQTVEWERIMYSHCKDLLGAWDYNAMRTGIHLRCVNADCHTHSYGAYAQSQPLTERERLPAPLGTSGGHIHECWKAWMIRRRTLLSTRTEADPIKAVPGIFSLQLDDLMSTFPTATWPVLVTEWLEAVEDPEEDKLKTFMRGRLARGWKQKSIEVQDNDIYQMVSPYRRGECPVPPAIVLMACDVQQVARKWVKRAYMTNGDSYVIDWGESLSFAALMEEADRPVRVLHWPEDTPLEQRVDPVVYKGIIDEGYIQKDVRDFVVSTYMGMDERSLPIYRFVSVWGQEGMRMRSARDLVWPRSGDPPNTTHNAWPLWCYRFSDDNFKDQLYNKTFGRFKELRDAEKAGVARPLGVARVHFPVEIQQDPGFVSELCAEKFGYNQKRRQWLWAEPKTKNDFGDAMKMNDVGWYVLAPALALREAQQRAERERAEKEAAALKH
jgi:hypothetical protein